MHTTTADMGSCLIIDNYNQFNLQLLSFVKKKIPDLKVFAWIEEDSSGFINEVSPNNVTIEIGPIATGTMKMETYERTFALVRSIKDFLEAYASDNSIEKGNQLEIFKYHSKLDYPRNEDGLLTAMLHSDFEKMNYKQLKEDSKIYYSLDEKVITYGKSNGLYPVFIGEASYYEKGFSCCLCEKIDLEV